MFNLTAQQKQTALWLGVAAALCALLYLLGPVLVPFALAAVLAYMLEPGVAWLVRKRLPRPAAVLLMIVLLGLVLLVLALILVPVLHKEAMALQQKFPAIIERLNASIAPWLADKLDVHLRFDAESIRGLLTDHLSNAGPDAASLWSSIRVGTSAVLGIVVLLFLVPMVLFYLLLDWPRLLERLRAALPRRWEHQVVGMVREIDTVLAQFLRGQIAVMVTLAVYYSVALALAGFDVALPVGILTGLLVFIPYVGYGLGLILALLSALLQFGNWYGLGAVIVVYGIGQVLEGFFLTPRLVGERIGLHPLAVIFALMAFGQLFGFVGVLVALPASAAILVGLKHVRNRYVASSFYRE
jgi:predicted PurR-regulated permease PerM